MRVSFSEAQKELPININGYTVVAHRAYWYRNFWTTKSEAENAVKIARRSGDFARIKTLPIGHNKKWYAVISASAK